jgi:hypothetical protein
MSDEIKSGTFKYMPNKNASLVKIVEFNLNSRIRGINLKKILTDVESASAYVILGNAKYASLNEV